MQELLSQLTPFVESGKSHLIALAGPPTSGKSTLAAQLINYFGEKSVVLPMDGFHLDNQILIEQGQLARKGAPHSFDVQGFLSLIKRIANGEHVYAPAFDRSQDLSRAGAIEIAAQPLIIVEGNYLLYNAPVWNELPVYWHQSIWLDVPIDIVRNRAIQRWLDQGYSYDQALQRAEENDVINAKEVINNRLTPDFIFNSYS